MENIFNALIPCPLFAGIGGTELDTLLTCLSAVRRSAEKQEFIFEAGDAAQSVGIVLSGRVYIVQEDYWGNRKIHAQIEPGGLFGETFSCAGVRHLPVSVIAAEKAEILLIDYRRIVHTCSDSCGFHQTLIHNMLAILAQKNIMLTQKMEIISRRTTRNRMLAYLSAQAIKAKSARFTIPFDRQELADYLAVERSALSAELSRMQKAGLINTVRHEFELLVPPEEEV